MTTFSRFVCSFFVLGFAAIVATTAGAEEPKLFSYEQAFGGSAQARFGAVRGIEGILGPLPEIKDWLDDETYLELRSDEDEDGKNSRLFAVRVADGSAEVYRDYPALAAALPEDFNIEKPADANDDLTRLVVAKGGDLYFVQLPEGTVQRLTATQAEEKNPMLSPDGGWVAYNRNNDLFAYDLENSVEHQLTADGTEEILNGYASWVYYEEILGRRGRHRAFWWSPDSSRLVFLRFDDSGVPKFPIYHADDQHGDRYWRHRTRLGSDFDIGRHGSGTIGVHDDDGPTTASRLPLHFLLVGTRRADGPEVLIDRWSDRIAAGDLDVRCGRPIEFDHL